jgi:hypothetical protein
MPLEFYAELEAKAREGDAASLAWLMRIAMGRHFVTRRAIEALESMGIHVHREVA